MPSIQGKRIAILATNGFEQSELEVPVKHLRAAGAEVHVVSLKSGEIRGWQGKDWGNAVPVDAVLSEVDASAYDALVLPGGQINPDLLRVEAEAISFIKSFWTAGKVIGAICHAPWLLVEAGIAEGRQMTSYGSIKTDLKNAGADWIDAEVVTDQGLVTSRKPEDLPAFCAKLVEEIAEGTHQRAAA
ncbi:type 1 glutamine amidotransferase domain-containing protein [Tabrizicola sp.]|uniref:type 1 glutamine amidotransferase domain-containing protein n=1 Tax=Tabrizicola sp. TaxID=2005166 RepID=UPI0027345875|nr:type 1 glutamine amidotransferase domain-containing protein [Tabrizicola sp.]MDP3197052.1 type 1 glutamine amidotransferase domain-containing protein [Tabrizicola sp.]